MSVGESHDSMPATELTPAQARAEADDQEDYGDVADPAHEPGTPRAAETTSWPPS